MRKLLLLLVTILLSSCEHPNGICTYRTKSVDVEHTEIKEYVDGNDIVRKIVRGSETKVLRLECDYRVKDTIKVEDKFYTITEKVN